MRTLGTDGPTWSPVTLPPSGTPLWSSSLHHPRLTTADTTANETLLLGAGKRPILAPSSHFSDLRKRNQHLGDCTVRSACLASLVCGVSALSPHDKLRTAPLIRAPTAGELSGTVAIMTSLRTTEHTKYVMPCTNPRPSFSRRFAYSDSGYLQDRPRACHQHQEGDQQR